MRVVIHLVVLVTCLMSTSLGTPQLFPFSNLRSYLDHQSKNGPENVKSVSAPELTTILDSPLFRQSSEDDNRSIKVAKVPKDYIPPNHKPDPSPSLEPPSPRTSAASVATFHPPIPEQVLKAPDSVPPILYTPASAEERSSQAFISNIPLAEATKTPQLSHGFIPLVLQNPSPASVHQPAVSFLPTVPSREYPSLYPQEEMVLNKKAKSKLKSESSVKFIKAPNHLYPKKWQPQEQKETNKKKYAKLNESNSNGESNAKLTKKKWKQTKREDQSEIDVQGEKSAVFPVRVASPLPNIDEQVAAETGFSGITAGVGGYDVGGGGGVGGGDRVEFQMHGQQGPHSYKFGYDTGKGHNRQFRYEERDTHGHVKGHYGFYNKHGKLQLVSYEAHPEHGFKAEAH